MWILVRAFAARWLLGRVIGGGLLSTLLLVPAAALLKLVGLPLFAVLAVIAVPLFMLLSTVGLPFVIALAVGGLFLLLLLGMLVVGGVLLQIALVAAAAVWVGRRVWRWMSRDPGAPKPGTGEFPATGSSATP